MNKKDKILIVVTVILIAVLAFGIIWDLNTFVFKRTLDTEITEDMEVISMKKYGMLFYRKAYEARIRVDRDKLKEKLEYTYQVYGGESEVYSYTDYLTFAADTFGKELLKPDPEANTEVAVIKTFNSKGDYVTFMFDVENETDGFIYIYYSRK